jgi:signal peptidase I
MAGRLWRELTSWLPVIFGVLLIRSTLVEAMMVPTPSMETSVKVGDFLLVNKLIYGIKVPFTHHQLVSVTTPKRGDVVVFQCPADPETPQPEANYIRLFPKWLPLLPAYWCRHDNPGFFGHRRGIVFYSPRNFVKRCVAIAGDTVELRDKQLLVNGTPVKDPHIANVRAEVFPAKSHPDYQRQWERAGFESDISVRDNFGPVIVPQGQVMAMGDNRDNSWDSRFWGPLDTKYLRGRPLVLYMSYAWPIPEGHSEYDYEVAPNAGSFVQILLNPFRIRLNRIGHLIS